MQAVSNMPDRMHTHAETASLDVLADRALPGWPLTTVSVCGACQLLTSHCQGSYCTCIRQVQGPPSTAVAGQIGAKLLHDGNSW
jgi:hypothetical protein